MFYVCQLHPLLVSGVNSLPVSGRHYNSPPYYRNCDYKFVTVEQKIISSAKNAAWPDSFSIFHREVSPHYTG